MKAAVAIARLVSPPPPASPVLRLVAPPPAPRPPVALSLEVLWAQRDFITERLLSRGVEERDVDEVLFRVLFSAHEAASRGRYTPNPETEPITALQPWLAAIAWHKASHWCELGARRFEVLVGDARPLSRATVELEARLLARETLRDVEERLSARHREILRRVALTNATNQQIAADLGRPLATLNNWLRDARRALPHARDRREHLVDYAARWNHVRGFVPHVVCEKCAKWRWAVGRCPHRGARVQLTEIERTAAARLTRARRAWRRTWRRG